MKKIVLSLLATITLTVPGLAADLPTKAPKMVLATPSPWDVAFGAGIATDYIFRGITQSNHRGSVNAYFEPRYNITDTWQLYGGVSGESIDFPNNAAAELDFYGGVRPTWGPIAFDFGAIEYYYPGGECHHDGIANCQPSLFNGNVAKSHASFYEIYAKAVYTYNDSWAFGANFFYTPNYVNTGAEGEYVSGTIKYTAPSGFLPYDIGFYASGEGGYQFLGTSDAFYAAPPAFPNGVPYADYATWNLGIGFTYKVFTLDLRYYDTDLTKADCNVLTSDQTAGGFPGSSDTTLRNPGGLGSTWCSATFVAKFSADLTLNTNIK